MFKGKKLYARGIAIKEYYNLDLTADEIYAKNLKYVKEGYDDIYEPKENVIRWCGDGILYTKYGEQCDPKDPNKTGWGNGGCDA